MIEPRMMGRKVTKPGYGEPEPIQPVHTCDSQENIDTCLDCPLTKCRSDHPACPLYRNGVCAQKRASPGQILDRDQAILELTRAGEKEAGICRKLGVKKWMVKDARRRARGRGEI